MVSNQKTIFFSRKQKKTKKTKKKTIFSKTMGLGPPKDGFFGFLEKKMVFLVRNHLFLERKMVFGGLLLGKPSFSREKDGFWRSSPGKTIFFSRKRWFYQEKTSKNHLFLEKKMVSNQKTIFFSRKPKKPKKPKKTKKPKKPSFPKLWGWGLQKMVFLVFLVFLVFSRKRWFFGSKPSFSREKDGFTRRRPPKTIFFSRKRWFRTKKPSFSPENQKNQKNQKNHLFQNYGAGASKRWFFWFFWFFWFSREKDGFLVRNHLFLEKKMVLPGEDLQKPSFSREKDGFEPKNHLFLEKTKKNQKNQKKKKNIFSKTMGLGPPKDGFFGFFFGFLEKKMVFWFETIFFSRKRWFLEVFSWENHLFLEKKMVSNQKNHLFLEKTKKTIFWRPQPHSFGKDGFFGFFGFLGFLVFCFFVSFLFCCCSLDLARTRMPPAVGPFGGGEHIYICVCVIDGPTLTSAPLATAATWKCKTNGALLSLGGQTF